MAMTNRYVTDSGTDTWANSTNIATPCSITTAAANATAGDHVWIKSGTYNSASSITFGAGALATSPLIIQGYNSAIGDLVGARNSNGTLNTTGMPVLVFTSSATLNTGNYCVVDSLNISMGYQWGSVMSIGNYGVIKNCRLDYQATAGTANALRLANTGSIAVNCDIYDAATGGSGYAVDVAVGSAILYGCRVERTGSGSSGGGVTAAGQVINCTILGTGATTGVGLYCSEAYASIQISGNTIAGWSSHGISLASTATMIRIIGNMITDNGGYGIYDAAAQSRWIARNRFRGNTSGVSNGNADWLTDYSKITSGSGSSDDYTNYGSEDLSIKSTSVAFQTGPGNLMNIGANGTPYSAGGGGIKTFSHA